MIARGPVPTVTIEEANASSAARAERDRQLARWQGLAPGEQTRRFLARLRAFDEHTPVWQARRLAAEREALAARLERAEGRIDAASGLGVPAPPSGGRGLGVRLGVRLTGGPRP